nr:hypothetical protein B0A51_03130 [Rachicladosporium sp. CCFEE 5018]
MNISAPTSSHISSVSFSPLSSTSIRALSARRITNPTTFDTLLNPIPGGLYTAELGQFGDNACATCGLKNPQCPGHCGHIELPVVCYHPTFMDMVLRLVRGGCVYCGRLKMARVVVNRFVCRLRLVRYGLLREMAELDELSVKTATKGGEAIEEESEEDEEEGVSGDTKELIEQRERFVKKAIRRARQEGRLAEEMTEAVMNARRVIIQEFMGSITKGTKCGNCSGLNHSYRKDRFVKIFRKPLRKEHRNKMIQAGMKAKDPVVVMYKREQALKERSRKRKRDIDEGVADMERSSDEEELVESSSDEGEVEIVGGDAMDLDAGVSTKTREEPEDTEVYLNQTRIHAQLEQLFMNEQEILSLIYGADTKSGPAARVSADMFFVRDILVPPNRFRPEARTGSDEISEAQENGLYKNVINACDLMTTIQRELSGTKERDERYRARTYADFENTWVTLQDAVNSLIDRDRNPVQGNAGKRNPEGVKQKLEKKEGMFRKYMMGKRVNFAARTVISPDPNIETNEIGVPPVFAVKLTFPEPVTVYNVEELQEAVRNGPHVWPGAIAIESETGQVTNLDRKNPEERTALANQLLAPSATNRGTRPKKVHRHLNNGDIVIMNRQPTLHKPSMMCHRARVLPGEKTLRMHYANCNTYNADFDGDEMNMHFPQNEIARAEALSIADTDHQYLSATAGQPLRGLIQDHISMGVWLTNRDTFFNREDYMQLLYAALRPESGHCTTGRLETVPPAVMKPQKLWTGKQVITSVLKNIKPPAHQGLTMKGVSTTPAKLWNANSEEATVIFSEGELMQGIIDKKQIGPSGGGLVNSVYEAYGHTVAGRLLSVLGRLLTKLLHMRAHSCGVEDLIFTRQGESVRQKALSGTESIGFDVSAKYVTLDPAAISTTSRELRRRLEGVLRDDDKMRELDQLTNTSTTLLSTAVTAACLPTALTKPFPKNQMQLMTSSGAKGSGVNANQISCNLGQQVLEGRRVPVMVSGKTLPCFKPFETSVRAGGYIVDRFLTGVRPQEFYFHAMAGREGLIDTAVKTSRSGYLQRCLIKGMEGLKVEYDSSVRDTDGSVIQFLYGEDGLDVAKAKYLSDFTFTAQNHYSLVESFSMDRDFESILDKDAQQATKNAEKAYRKSGSDLGASDPAMSIYNPSRQAGAISEKLFASARDYMDNNPDSLIKDKKKNMAGRLTKNEFRGIQDMRYMRSVVEPGEAVGVIAGQSVGEPSTQMTLNTFHLAGHAAKNVTLGIPRLREIVMTAATNIATPLMTLKLHDEISAEEGRRFAKGISRLALSEVVDSVEVRESVGKGIAYEEAKKYEVRLQLFSREEYGREYAITVQDVVSAIEFQLLPRLQAMTRKELKKRKEEKSLKGSAQSDAMPDIGKSAGATEQESGRAAAEREGGDDDSDDDGDDDATRDKAKGNRQQAGYEAYEDEEDADLAAKVAQQDDAASDSEPEDEAYGGSPRSPKEGEDIDMDVDSRTQKILAADRESRIKGSKSTNDITSFAFDPITSLCTFTLEYAASTAKLLLLSLLERACKEALIQSVENISSAAFDEATFGSSNGATKQILTAGVNIKAMWDYQHIVPPNHILPNSTASLLHTYGVEAARSSIVLELSSVFAGHGISVDVRHLTLIADYMTRDGEYKAFNRMGFRGNVSPFMKMSFETTVGFLREAVLGGEVERLAGPSARIVVGRLGGVGTGGCGVFTRVEEKGKEEEVEGSDVEMQD